MLTYCVTIHNNGKLLEICVPSATHGSHVANIAAAHFPDEPEKNGLAPGAQIISMCIGDSRVGNNETGQALTRAVSIHEIGYQKWYPSFRQPMFKDEDPSQ